MCHFSPNELNNTVKHIILFIIVLIKSNQWARSIFGMLYLPWPDQKVITDRKNPIGIIEGIK